VTISFPRPPMRQLIRCTAACLVTRDATNDVGSSRFNDPTAHDTRMRKYLDGLSGGHNGGYPARIGAIDGGVHPGGFMTLPSSR
jgi:hypothetical protein